MSVAALLLVCAGVAVLWFIAEFRRSQRLLQRLDHWHATDDMDGDK